MIYIDLDKTKHGVRCPIIRIEGTSTDVYMDIIAAINEACEEYGVSGDEALYIISKGLNIIRKG